MKFSTDRDLLLYEPTLFNDLPWVSQQRLRVTDGEVNGTTLTSAQADFEAAQVDTGSVLLVNKTPIEVLSRIDTMTLTVSLPRTRTTDAAIPNGDMSSAVVVARTFAPQAELVCASLLRMLGLDNGDSSQTLNADAVVSLSLMARLESLGTLERVFSSAAALTGDNDALLFKAAEYRRRLRQAAARCPVQIDTTGDGLPDEKRYLGVGRLTRI
jgi:phosphohistidine swiveling domain-containing protein